MANLLFEYPHIRTSDQTDCVYSNAVKTCDIFININMFGCTQLVIHNSTSNS